ncbi:MAG: radical SAM protein [Archangium sp.]|nr:radical SAM protein [Archangium sp.]
MANLGYMQVVRHCNQYCRFCSNPSSGYVLDLETAKKEIDDFAQRKYFGVILTGGEPSLSPLIPEITRYAVDHGLHVRMITNGSQLAKPGLAQQYADAGLKHFHVSIHSVREDLEDFLTGVKGSHALAMSALQHLTDAGVTININTVINRFNADHLDENVQVLYSRFPSISHQVWNNLDPSMGRAETNRDTAHRLADFELSLARAMRWLHKAGRTFRVERVPLCYMTEFAHCSTETRKIIKKEERIVHFLDSKGTIRQTDWMHAKSEACKRCSLNDICGGLFELGDHYDLGELHPVFVPAEPIVQRVLADQD